MRIKALVDHSDCPLQEAINWLRSSLCTPAVRCIVSWPSSKPIWIDSHLIACCFLFFLLPVLGTVLNLHPGPYIRWLQLQRCSRLTGVCVATDSHRVAHWSKRLLFGSIRLQLHLVEVFLEPWLAVVERWGRLSWKEVESPDDYIVSYKSKWNDWQPTWSINSSWILLRIAALHIAARHYNGPTICSKSVRCCLFVYRDTSWWTTADISCLIDIKRTFFDGKDSWCCLSQDITGSYMNHTLIIKS